MVITAIHFAEVTRSQYKAVKCFLIVLCQGVFLGAEVHVH